MALYYNNKIKLNLIIILYTMSTQIINNKLYVGMDYLNKAPVPKEIVPKAPNNQTVNYIWEIASTTDNAGINVQTAQWTEIQNAPPSSDAIINSEPSITSTQGSFLVSDGTNPFNAHFTDLLKADDNQNVINTYGDIRLHNTTSNPNYSSIGMNEDNGLDIANYNGEITFATTEYTRTLKEIVEQLDLLTSQMDSVIQVLYNLTNIQI